MATFSAGHWAGRVLCSAVLGAALLSSTVAQAATARVRWLPSAASGLSGYRVYVRGSGAMYGNAQWSGNPTTPDADGALSALVTYTTATSGVNYFTVVAVSNTVESGLARELPIGAPNPCTVDSCWTKTNCAFTAKDDGTSCDDASFCNGPEVCLGGVCRSSPRNCADAVACTVDGCDEGAHTCTHVGPPGCCAACDTDDPCLADACQAGDCTAEGGIEIDVNRVRLLSKASGVKLAAKGRFVAALEDADPTVSGAEIDLLAADGTMLFQSFIAPSSFRHVSTGRYRYVATRSESEGGEHGVNRLDFRVKGTDWQMTLKGDTALLADAFNEASLTWVVRMNTLCARRLHMACDLSEQKSTCR